MFRYKFWLRAVLVLGSLSTMLLLAVPRTTAATPDPQLRIYPYLQSTTSNSVVVVWTTNVNLSSEIRYSLDNSFSLSVPATSTAQSTGNRYQHEAVVTGLSPATTYHYRIFSGGTEMLPGDPDLTFTTAPLPDNRSFRFLVFGDSGTGYQTQKSLRDQMLRDLPYDFMLHVGDIAYPDATYGQFEGNYFKIYQDIFKHVPIFPVIGNHEYLTDNGAPYFALHVLPVNTVPAKDAEHYYSFDWGDAHFVAIDSDPAGPITTKVFKDWLAADLGSTTKTWKFVYMHHPAYSSGSHGPEPNVQALVPLFEQYHVDVVFNGHDHDYERTVPIRANAQTTTDAGGIVYITSGSGSAFNYPCPTKPAWWTAFMQCNKPKIAGYTRVTLNDFQLTLEGVRDNGTIFDSYVINKNVSVQPTATSTPTATPSDRSLPTPTPFDTSIPTTTPIDPSLPTTTPTSIPTQSSPEPVPVASYFSYIPIVSKDETSALATTLGYCTIKPPLAQPKTFGDD